MFKKIIIEMLELVYPATDLPSEGVFLFTILVVIALFSTIVWLLFWPFIRR